MDKEERDILRCKTEESTRPQRGPEIPASFLLALGGYVLSLSFVLVPLVPAATHIAVKIHDARTLGACVPLLYLWVPP